MAAARDLFYLQGFGCTSLKAIAEAAEVNPGSVYYFFPAKSDILEAVLEEYLELLEPVVIAPARAAGPDPIDVVMTILAGYREHLDATGFRLGCPIGNLALEVSDEFPAARRLIVRNFEAWRRAIRTILGEASWPDGTDLDELATLVLTIMEGGVMQARSERSVAPFDASARHLRRYLESLVHEELETIR